MDGSADSSVYNYSSLASSIDSTIGSTLPLENSVKPGLSLAPCTPNIHGFGGGELPLPYPSSQLSSALESVVPSNFTLQQSFSTSSVSNSTADTLLGSVDSTSSSLLVGVIDTGFTAANLSPHLDQIKFGHDYVDGDENPLLQPGEGNEHGSHILNVITAAQPNVNSLWLSRAVGSGHWADALTEFVNATTTTGQPHAVVNLSFDLTQTNPDGTVTTRHTLTTAEWQALSYARDQGVLVVVAAGNTGAEMSALGQASQWFDNVITVGAAEAGDHASYSSTGNGLTLLAPGNAIADKAIQGTSVAAAEVTAAVAGLWKANPNLSYRQIVELLSQTAIDLNSTGWDAQTGWGLIDVTAATVAASTGVIPHQIAQSSDSSSPIASSIVSLNDDLVVGERPVETVGTHTVEQTGNWYNGKEIHNYTTDSSDTRQDGSSTYTSSYHGLASSYQDWHRTDNGENIENLNSQSQANWQNKTDAGTLVATTYGESASEDNQVVKSQYVNGFWQSGSGDRDTTSTTTRGSQGTYDDGKFKSKTNELNYSDYSYTSHSESGAGYRNWEEFSDNYEDNTFHQENHFNSGGIINEALRDQGRSVFSSQYYKYTINGLQAGSEDTAIWQPQHYYYLNFDPYNGISNSGFSTWNTVEERHRIYTSGRWTDRFDYTQKGFDVGHDERDFGNGLKHLTDTYRSYLNHSTNSTGTDGRSISTTHQEGIEQSTNEWDNDNTDQKGIVETTTATITDSGIDEQGQPWSHRDIRTTTITHSLANDADHWVKQVHHQVLDNGTITLDETETESNDTPASQLGQIASQLAGTGLSLALNLTPGVGTIKGVVEAITGRDAITGEKLAPWERLINILPVASVAGDAADGLKAIHAITGAIEEGSDAAKAATASGDLAKAQKIAQETDAALDVVQKETRLVQGLGDADKAAAVEGDLARAQKAVDETKTTAQPNWIPQSAYNEYSDITKGSSIPNRNIDLTRAEFEQNLIDQGYTKFQSKDGKVTILQNSEGGRYTLRDTAKSTGEPTAEYFINNEMKVKLRLKP